MSWRDRATPVTEAPRSSWRDRATPVVPETSQAESAILGGIKGLSQNYIDEIAGGLEAAGSLLGVRGVGGSFSDLRLESDEEDAQSLRQIYEQARDAKRAAYDKAQADNPTTFAATNIAGNVASSLAMPIKSPKTIAEGAKVGAALAGVQGFGAAEGELQDQIVDTAKSAAAGGVLGGAFQAAAKTVKPLAEGARDLAARQAYRTTGGLKTDINKLYNMSPEDIGNELLDRGLVKIGTKRGSEALAGRVDDELAKFSSGQDKLLNALDEGAPQSFNVSETVKKLREQVDDYINMGGASNRSYANALTKEADILEEVYLAKGRSTISLKEATKLKRDFDKGGKFQSPLSEAASVEAARTARGGIKRQIDDTISQIADPSVASRYEQARTGASRLLSAKSALEQAKARETANKAFGITDLLGGAIGATAGAITGGPGAMAGVALGIAANKAITNYGASTSAVLLRKASDLVRQYGFDGAAQRMASLVGASTASQVMDQVKEQEDKKPKGVDLGKRVPRLPPQYQAVFDRASQKGGNAAAVTHHTLFSKDPEYRRMMQEMDEQESQ